MNLNSIYIWFLILFIVLVFVSVAITFINNRLVPDETITDENYKNVSQRIPKILHKVHLTTNNDTSISNPIRNAQESWSKMNPGYEIKYWNMQSCENYLKNNFPPVYLETFQRINSFAGKCNFFRYCIVFQEGGWYSDWKQVCLKRNILKKLSFDKTFVYFQDKGCKFTIENKCIQNAFFGAVPNHPVLKEVIHNAIENTRIKYYGKHALDTTGVCLFGKTIRNSVHPTNSSGKFQSNFFHHNSYGVIVQHKCDLCPKGQTWKNGNNYNTLWTKRMYYSR